MKIYKIAIIAMMALIYQLRWVCNAAVHLLIAAGLQTQRSSFFNQ
jgi:hypothetical protein